MLNARFGLLCVGFVALGGFAQAQDGAASLEFKRVNPTTGDTRTNTFDSNSTNKIEVSMNGAVVQTLDQVMKESKSETVEILEADEKGVSKLKVTVVRDEKSEKSGPGEAETVTSDLVGKSFIVSKSGEETTVTTAEGEAVEAELAEQVAKSVKDSIGPHQNRFADLLPKGPVKVGEVIKVDPKVAERLFNGEDDEEQSIESMSLTLSGQKSVDGVECGIFKVKLVIASEPEPGMKLTIDLSGELAISLDKSWPYSMKLSGPLSMSGSQQEGDTKIDLSSKGEMKMVVGGKYGRAGR